MQDTPIPWLACEPQDGAAPRLALTLFVHPEPDRDCAFDAQIILHELTHGLVMRWVGAGPGVEALQSKGLAEGWCDFYPLALLSEPGDINETSDIQPLGAYSYYRREEDPVVLMENYYFGMRRYPYSTDLDVMPLTFGMINQTYVVTNGLSQPKKQGTTIPVPLNPLWEFVPETDTWDDAIGTTDEHCLGEVWCATLWDMRANLIAKYEFDTGNALALQLVTDGMRLCPPEATSRRCGMARK